MATVVETPTPSSSTPQQPAAPPSLLPTKLTSARPLFDPEIVKRAVRDSFVKLNPKTLLKNPVIFAVEVGAALVTMFLVRDVATRSAHLGFEFQIALWLWFTVLF